MFKVFQKILDGSHISVEESKKVSEFLLCRWLSGDPRLADFANALNLIPFKNFNQHQIVLSVQNALKGKVKFIKFPKKSKTEEQDEKLLLEISDFFRISLQESREFLDWTNKHCPDELELLKKILDFKDGNR